MDNEAVGRTIRKLRKDREWTLEELSTRCGLSVGFLSQVERGLSSLSVASLKTVCDALEVPLAQFFTVSDATDRPAITRAGEPHYQMRIGTSEITYSMLSGSRPNRMMEAFIAEYPPGYSPPVLPHEGEEFAYVLSGTVLLIFEGEEHVLEPGDSFQIDSSRPHTVRNPDEKPAQVLWVQTLKILR